MSWDWVTKAHWVVDMVSAPAAQGLLGAIVGATISAGAVLWQTRRLLNSQAQRRLEEQEREARSVASGLLAEIDDFYKSCIRDVCRKLRGKDPENLDFYAKSLTLRIFTVFEANAGKVGLFEPETVQAVVGFYGEAKNYLNTVGDYASTLDKMEVERAPVREKAVSLLRQVQEGADAFVPLTKAVCELLAARAQVKYTFDPP